MLASTRPDGRHTLGFRVLIHRSQEKDIRAARDIILQLRSEVERRPLRSQSNRAEAMGETDFAQSQRACGPAPARPPSRRRSEKI